MSHHIKPQPRNERPSGPPNESIKTKDFIKQVQYDINGIYYTPSAGEGIKTCICRCLILSDEHRHPVEMKFNGVTLVIDNKQSPWYSYWKDNYDTEVLFGEPSPPLRDIPNGRPDASENKAPFTPVKEEGKPKGFGTERIGKTPTPPRTRTRKGRPPTVGCSRCDGEWGKCKHSDGSTEARKLDDNILWFFFGCLFGLIAAYIIGTNLIGA